MQLQQKHALIALGLLTVGVGVVVLTVKHKQDNADGQDNNTDTSYLQDLINKGKNAMNGNHISSIVSFGAGYLICQRPDGSTDKLTGARNWRNNNPGNLEYGSFAQSCGAIGSDGRFAIFPTFEQGQAAREKLLFEGKNYKDLTLSKAIARYAPPGENNTSAYQKNVLASVGNVDKPMSDYDDNQRAAILDAMMHQEGFKAGTVEAV